MVSKARSSVLQRSVAKTLIPGTAECHQARKTGWAGTLARKKREKYVSHPPILSSDRIGRAQGLHPLLATLLLRIVAF